MDVRATSPDGEQLEGPTHEGIRYRIRERGGDPDDWTWVLTPITARVTYFTDGRYVDPEDLQEPWRDNPPSEPPR